MKHGDEVYEFLQDLKHNNRNMVLILKNLGNMSPSLIRYLKSSNEAIRSEYEIITRDILAAFQLAYMVELQDEGIDKLEHIAKLERMIEEGDITKNTRYAKLLSEKTINQTMATALLNDSYLKKNILQSIFDLIQYHSLRDLQTQVKQEDREDLMSNKWIYKFRKKPIDRAEKIIEKLRKKEKKVKKKLQEKGLSSRQKKYFKEELKDISYALKHYHDILGKSA